MGEHNMELTKTSKPNDVVSFGMYPSTLVTDKKTIKALQTISFNQYGVGLLEGKKFLKSDESFYEFNDLKWIVLKKKPDGVFQLITKDVVDRCPREVKHDNGRTFTFFNYLNAVFPNRAFSEKERGMLQMMINSGKHSENYVFVNYPDSSIAEKLSSSPIEFSDYVKRFTGEKPDSYHLFKESIGAFGGTLFETFDIEKKEVFWESNPLFPIGLRPVIEVKAD